MVLLPAPVGPTTASFSPGEMAKDTSRSTGSLAGYAKLAWRNSTLPSNRSGNCTGCSGSCNRSSQSIAWNMRSPEAMARNNVLKK